MSIPIQKIPKFRHFKWVQIGIVRLSKKSTKIIADEIGFLPAKGMSGTIFKKPSLCKGGWHAKRDGRIVVVTNCTMFVSSRTPNPTSFCSAV